VSCIAESLLEGSSERFVLPKRCTCLGVVFAGRHSQHISSISTLIIDITCDINSCDHVWVLRSSLTVAMYLQIGIGGV
jgi:predicted nucleic acid binding AN1-type Zn finger protein